MSVQFDTIYNEECSEGMKRIPDEFVDLTVTSPPYDNLRTYNGFSFDYKSVIRQLYRVTKSGGVVVWVVGDQTIDGSKSLTSFKHALFFKSAGFKVYDVMIYEKAGVSPPHKNRYFNSFEYMFVCSKGTPKTINLLKDKENRWAGTETFGECTIREADGSLTKKGVKKIPEFSVRTNIWRYANGKRFSTTDEIAYNHPAMFPEKLATDHILSWSNPGDIVLDPFMGSGTTAKCAMVLQRKYIGFEISKEYVEIANRRLNGVQQYGFGLI